MSILVDHPLLVFLVSLAAFWSSAWIGARLRGWKADGREHFSFILGGTLTLLGLIVGFTFSMAVGRYDQRKNYEEQEANAIGTEYARADLLPAEQASKVRGLLRSYTDQRIAYYVNHDEQRLQQIEARTARLQADLWSAVATHASAQPTPTTALVISGMNDVLNSQGYTQAAWWNRIPRGAWLLMILIAIFCNALIGYSARERGNWFFLILPSALAITFLLIADIDSPRGGLIHVFPQNLEATAQSLRAQ
jgi:hypothetical protein